VCACVCVRARECARGSVCACVSVCVRAHVCVRLCAGVCARLVRGEDASVCVCRRRVCVRGRAGGKSSP
jgi:hypothetical protein